MVTLKEYEAYLKVKRFIDGHDESEIISRLINESNYVPLIIESDDADPITVIRLFEDASLIEDTPNLQP